MADTILDDAKNVAYGLIDKLLGGSTTKKNDLEKLRKKEKVVNYMTKEVRLGNGLAEVRVSQNRVILAADENTGIGISDGMIIMDGNVHFLRAPDNLIIQGFWRLNEECLTTVPSTLMNPVQTLVFKYPSYVKKASKLMKLLSLG
jgi:hypothetical protein